MNRQNRYCCRCHRTTQFQVEKTTFTCTACGVVIELGDKDSKERNLIGNPLRSFKTSFAA